MYRLSHVISIGVACLLATMVAAEPIATPSLINPRLRVDPAPVRQNVLRFLTTDDNPPFNFVSPDGALSGFNVDLARALCQQLKAACTIQARRPDLVVEALTSGGGDALIPAPQGRPEAGLALSLPYLPRAARFAIARSAPPLAEATVATLANRTVGVVADSPHARFLARFFPAVRPQTFPSLTTLLDAFAKTSIDLVFADTADLAFWLNGVAAGDCCMFVPGYFVDPSLFGAGYTIATRAADDDLRRSIDTALTQLDSRGALTEIYLRYFPIPLF